MEPIPTDLTVSEVAVALNCSRRQVFILLSAGKLRRGATWGRCQMITRESVRAILEPPPPPKPRVARARIDRDQAERQLRKLYGLTSEDWARLWEAQGGKCPGCLRPLTYDSLTHVDHCHASGRVRGLLCAACNHALGKVGDSPETLQRLAAYLAA